MQHRAFPLVAPILLGFASLAALSAAHAQGANATRTAAPVAQQLALLSRERVRQWAATAPRIQCAPAPLTERPTAGAEFARPRVLPLEAAFLDAATVKRTFVARGAHLAGSN
jgi:hypothetical protein